jgi:hypothetical protein
MILGGAVARQPASQSLRPFEFFALQKASGGQRQIPETYLTTVFGSLFAAGSRFMLQDLKSALTTTPAAEVPVAGK